MTILCDNYQQKALPVKGVLWILYAVLKDQSSIKGPALLIHSNQCILGWKVNTVSHAILTFFLNVHVLISFKISIDVGILASWIHGFNAKWGK